MVPSPCLLLLNITEEVSLSLQGVSLQQGEGETLWFARGETVWAPNTALKTPFPFNPPHNKETPSLQPLFPTLVPLPIPPQTPLFAECLVPRTHTEDAECPSLSIPG